jgi:hypothetical protein
MQQPEPAAAEAQTGSLPHHSIVAERARERNRNWSEFRAILREHVKICGP